MTFAFPIRALGALAALCLLATLARAADPPKPVPAPIQQLRIYEIFEDTKPHFHARFRDHALRIMQRYDFRIVAMWETRQEQRTEFAYLLEWPDEATMKDRWARFMADEEWSRIKRETRSRGRMVGQIQDRTLHMVEYSPQRHLLD
ncbi:NIPSNAP family protein [Lysobacter firmicutimachus]|uniref:NIPSNAP family protein n=1 Tax=Lysobacter firmicutimachus TaxID=1792846 RepID=A0AAU8MW51_9GAMM|nr:NIPSNAP family protein [Lysobacter antibioticus]